MKNRISMTLFLLLSAAALAGCGREAADETVREASSVSEASSVPRGEKETASSEADSPGNEATEDARNTAAPTASPSPTPDPEELLRHVSNIRNFSLIQGTEPDPMSGISWDSSIQSVSCDTGTADWNTPGTYTLTYTVTGAGEQTASVSVQATVETDLEQYLYGMEGDAEIRVGESFDPMANVTHDDEVVSIVPDTTDLNPDAAGEYLISYQLTGRDGKTQTAVRKVTVTDAAQPGADTSGYSTVTDLGLWRLTAYMDTPADQGQYVGQTASGSPLVAGETVAVSQATCARLGLQFGDRLMIDGHIYTLEDYGGSAMNDQNWVDIFVNSEADEYSEQYNKYTEVYLLR